MSTLFAERARLKYSIREFFVERGYLEIDTPVLVQTPGAEIHLEYFRSEWFDHAGNARSFYLRSSPEIHMKRVLATTPHSNVFQFAPSFRNHGELGTWHHPEFTMLEWYHQDGCIDTLIAETSQLLKHVSQGWAQKTLPEDIPVYTVAELFATYARLDPFSKTFLAESRTAGLTNIHNGDDEESAFFKIMLDVIEPQLRSQSACFVKDYPVSTASLAQVSAGVAKRVELYLDGLEVANGFQELVGARENLNRLQEIETERRKLGKKPLPIDTSFAKDMGRLGPCAGNALGFDRLLAWLIGADSLKDVVPFADEYQVCSFSTNTQTDK